MEPVKLVATGLKSTMVSLKRNDPTLFRLQTLHTELNVGERSPLNFHNWPYQPEVWRQMLEVTDANVYKNEMQELVNYGGLTSN